MGVFKDSVNLGLQYAFLINLGFKYGERSGAQGETGYTKVIRHNENEYLYITVDTNEKKVYLHNELDCGYELWGNILYAPDSALKNEREFIDWLDEKIGSD